MQLARKAAREFHDDRAPNPVVQRLAGEPIRVGQRAHRCLVGDGIPDPDSQVRYPLWIIEAHVDVEIAQRRNAQALCRRSDVPGLGADHTSVATDSHRPPDEQRLDDAAEPLKSNHPVRLNGLDDAADLVGVGRDHQGWSPFGARNRRRYVAEGVHRDLVDHRPKIIHQPCDHRVLVTGDRVDRRIVAEQASKPTFQVGSVIPHNFLLFL